MREFDFVMPYTKEKPHLRFWNGAWWIMYYMTWCEKCRQCEKWVKKKNKEHYGRAVNCNELEDGNGP